MNVAHCEQAKHASNNVSGCSGAKKKIYIYIKDILTELRIHWQIFHVKPDNS